MTCTQLVDSGVYVLGALAPSQRAAFEQHMSTCAECRAEVSDLAVLPGLLGRLDEPSVVASAELPAPTVLPGVLAKVHRQRRGRRVLAGVAGVIVAVLALVAGLNMPSSGPATTPTAQTAQHLAWHQMVPVGAAEPESVVAKVAFTTVTGGTQVTMKCEYPSEYGTAGTKVGYALFAIPSDGSAAQRIITWRAGPGDSIVAPGLTGWTLPQMSRIELRSSTGEPLLYYTIPA